MKTAVLKFGGTSVANEDSRACAIERVKDALTAGYSTAVVVSAMGRKGMPYATDTLLSLIGTDAPGETKDLLMSCGETISACVFADSLCKAGIKAVPMNALTAGIKTDGTAQSAEITDIDTSRIEAAMAEGNVVVVTGFQGISADNRFNTLGRGGSDTSAVTLAAYLKADECIIYTDVPGAAECDPRIVPKARFYDEINAEQMYLLAQNGAGVIHERAVKAAMNGNVNMFIRSTFNREKGTRIANSVEKKAGFAGMAKRSKGDKDEIFVLFEGEELPAKAVRFLEDRGASFTKDGSLVRIASEPDKTAPVMQALYDALTEC